MGWFDDQIRERIENDNQDLHNACLDLAAVVGNKTGEFHYSKSDRNIRQMAFAQLCHYFKIREPKQMELSDDLMRDVGSVFQPAGIMYRRVRLDEGWWKRSVGPLLGITKEDQVIAFLPKTMGGYYFLDPVSGEKETISEKNADRFTFEAVCFYRPLPQRELSVKDLAQYMVSCLSAGDFALFAGMTLLLTLIGFAMPALNQIIFSSIIPAKNISMVISMAVLMLGIAVSNFLISAAKTLVQERIQTKMEVELGSAVFGRVLNLPAKFFQNYAAGDLASRVKMTESLCTIVCQVVFGFGLTTLFSVLYIFQIYAIAPSLALPAFLIVLTELLLTIVHIYGQMKLSRHSMKAETKVSSVVYALFSGIQKIKLSGSEKRSFAKWASVYKERAESHYAGIFSITVVPALLCGVSLLGTLIIFNITVSTGVSMAQYVAFNSAFGMVSGAVVNLSSAAGLLGMLFPVMEMAEPILKAVPEMNQKKEPVKSLSGSISVSHVSFRYTEDGPLILDDLSLDVKAGEYLAIVGTTGCGKSTLMRLLLGFETPEMGAVYYDGKDLSKLDIKDVRRQIGAVTQNGKLFCGDIYSNIAISAPGLTLEDAWEAARMAGMEEDIKKMPMGMYTLINEDAGGISGGQRQRLMIARAIAPKPAILMFDEATSALDNITQKQVSDALEGLKSTRIVIAHRLSTIKECDRIIVLNKGKIIEQGTYEELNAAGGFFSELVKRQQV